MSLFKDLHFSVFTDLEPATAPQRFQNTHYSQDLTGNLFQKRSELPNNQPPRNNPPPANNPPPPQNVFSKTGKDLEKLNLVKLANGGKV